MRSASMTVVKRCAMAESAGDALGDDGLSQVLECAGGLVEHQDARAADLAEVQGEQLASIVGDRAGIRGLRIRAGAA